MTLRVQYMSQLRTVIGRSHEDLEFLEGRSVADLLKDLAKTYPEASSHFVTEVGQPRPSLLIVVNDIGISARTAGNTILHPNDVVTLLPPVAGG